MLFVIVVVLFLCFSFSFVSTDEVYIIIGVVVNPSILPSIFLLLSSRDALGTALQRERAL